MWKTYFSDPTERKTDDIEANKSNLRFTLNALQTSLYNIFNAIVRASPEARKGVLTFFAQVVSLNSRRAGMRVDPSTVSSDGYMTNLQIVLLKLFEPVMDASYSKVRPMWDLLTLDRQSGPQILPQWPSQHRRRDEDQRQ